MHITSVPELIKQYGTMKKVHEETGFAECSIYRYRFDTCMKDHIIINGRLFTARKTSRWQMLWSDIQAACEESDFLYEETGKHHSVIQVGSMMMVIEHHSSLQYMYSTVRYQ